MSERGRIGRLAGRRDSKRGLRLLPADGGGATLQRLAAGLRALSRPVIGRIVDGALVLDLRCLTDEAAFLAGFDDLSLS
jgi:L-seryl-tRNA(Ser) seleniumtransferase